MEGVSIMRQKNRSTYNLPGHPTYRQRSNKRSLTNLILMMVIIIGYQIEVVHCQLSTQTFQISQVSIENKTVDATTDLIFQLMIRRSVADQQQIQVQEFDYLLLDIPAITTTAEWDVSTEPTCSLTGDSQPKKCEIKTTSQAKIIFNKINNLVIHGRISNFKNPHSVAPLSGIQVSLWNRRGELKILASSLTLNTFEPSFVDAKLQSSSDLIGAKSVKLIMEISPWTRMTAQGRLLFRMPDYYDGASNDFMFSKKEPTPCTCNLGRVNTCVFNQKQKMITIDYEFKDKKDKFGGIIFTIGQFNNPVIDKMTGFSFELQDKDFNEVAESKAAIYLEGITRAARFKQYDFNYVDFPHSGVYAVHQFILLSNVPVQRGCWIRIVYPEDMTVDGELKEIQGVGFAEPGIGQDSLTFSITGKNQIDILACQKNFGLSTLATITLYKVKNQHFKHTLEDFKVYMTQLEDPEFESVYQKVTDGFRVKSTQQKAGRMSGTVVASSYLVQTTCTITFKLTLSQFIQKSAFILIDFPEALAFQSKGCSVSKKTGVSDQVFCKRTGRRAFITKVFDEDKKPGFEFSMTIEMFQMPTSVQEIGNIKYVFIDMREGKLREVDVFEDNSIQSTPGKLSKTNEVQVTSDQTSLTGQTYTFSFKMYHAVPLGGFFSILLSMDEKNGVSITNPMDVRTNCHRILPNGEVLGLKCVTGRTDFVGQPFVNVTCSRAVFGDTGTAKEASIKLKIGGLTNPRLLDKQSQFKIQTMDKEYRYIDISPPEENFQVTMKNLIQITAIEVRINDPRNGARTKYTIRIIPSIKIYSGDIFKITFPKEMELEQNPECGIGEAHISHMEKIECKRIGQRGIQFQILQIKDVHEAGIALEFIVYRVRNPYSTRPSSSFTDIVFIDGNTGGNMAHYTESLIVSTNEIDNLNPLKAGIIQSSYKPTDDADIEISFQTNNPLPSTAAIVIDAPLTLMNVYQDTQFCGVKIQDQTMSEPKVPTVIRCKILKTQIIITEAFSDYTSQDFLGRVMISFRTQNPKDTQNLNLLKISYMLTIWDSDELKYGIDNLRNVLYPSLKCAYPCDTCSSTNPFECYTCLPQKTAPQFLHTPIDVPNPNQTCVDICPQHQGYTSNGSRDPKRCVKCHHTCQECAQNDKLGDVDICTKCQPDYPFLWLNRSTCHSSACPDESYLYNPFMCLTCGDTCMWCSDRLTCTKCNPLSVNAYLHYRSCIPECPFGYTPVDNVCIPCEDPCETCKFGDPKTCTSCDNTGDKQFLYESQCLQDCPINTTMYLENRTCVGCLDGCALCDYDKVNICKKCHQGLLLHDNKCVEECPFNFTEASDDSVCEPRTYLLDERFVPIPFIGGAFFFGGLTGISHWLTGKNSLVASSMIGFLGPIEMAACGYQIYYALRDDKKFIPIIIGSTGAFLSGLLVNFSFLVSFNKQVKNQDRQFERWRKQKWCISNLMLALCCVTSITIYRLIFSRLYSLEIFNVSLNRPQVFLRPILIFTWIKFFIFNIPLICVNIYGISALNWGNQCQMTMVESLFISLLSLGLMIWESMRKNSLIESQLDLKSKELDEDSDMVNEYQGLGSKIVPGEIALKENEGKNAQKKRRKRQALSLNNIMFQLQNHVTKDELREAQLRPRPTPRTLQKRVRQLAGVLDHIRKQRDLFLNDETDYLLEMEVEKTKKAIRRCRSMEEIKTKEHNTLRDDVSEEYTIDSYPGYKIKIEEKMEMFEEFKDELRQIRQAENNKAEQWEEQVEMNIYVSARDPPPEKSYEDQPVQTLQEKKMGKGADSITAEKMAKQKRDLITMALKMKKERDEEYVKQKKKEVKRRGKKFYLVNPLDSEEDIDDEDSDQAAKDGVPLMFGKPQSDMIQLAMKVEKEQSLTLFHDLQQQQYEVPLSESEQVLSEKKKQEEGQLLDVPAELMSPKGIELSRISGDLDFSDDEEFNNKLLELDPDARRLHEVGLIDNIQAWLNEKNNLVHMRTFNENDIMGNFVRDWAGKIVDKENTLRQLQFKDLDGYAVNQNGYLIDVESGDLKSKYTFDSMFANDKLIGLHDDNKYELPLPFRMERFNFNPHQCFGNFEYEDDDKPMILQDIYGRKMDRNWRPVNASGWLIDEDENIIDNQGHVKLIHAQLMPKGQMPTLYNYEGREYQIQSIMGVFEKDIQTKEIILSGQDKQEQKNPKKTNQQLKIKSADLRGRRVNSNGYLLDDLGNIIDKQGNIIWRSHELLYNEPPKLFNFTEFSVNWIKGLLDHDLSAGSIHNHEFDNEGRRINSLGYLVDDQGNIVDRWSNQIIFRKVLLEEYQGQESQIPYIFRSGQLCTPDDEIEHAMKKKLEDAITHHGHHHHDHHHPQRDSGDEHYTHIDRIERKFMFANNQFDGLSIEEQSQDLEISSRRQDQDTQYEGHKQSSRSRRGRSSNKDSKNKGSQGKKRAALAERQSSSRQLRGSKQQKKSMKAKDYKDSHRAVSAMRGSQQVPTKDKPPAVKRNQFMLSSPSSSSQSKKKSVLFSPTNEEVEEHGRSQRSKFARLNDEHELNLASGSNEDLY